jgi:hypothetical protein
VRVRQLKYKKTTLSCKEGLNREGGLPLKTSKEVMLRIIMPREMHEYLCLLSVLYPLIPQSPFKFSCGPTHLEELGRVKGGF